LGPKAQKVAWIDNDTMFTSGFNKGAEREYGLWDVRDLSKSIATAELGSGLGVGHLYFDMQHNLMHLAGRGEMNVSVFEIDKAAPAPCKFIYSWVGATPQKAFSIMEKDNLDVSKHEVNRAVRVSNNNLLEYYSFKLPNRTGQFQPELYPAFPSAEASNDYDAWAAGTDKPSNMMTLTEKKVEQCLVKKNTFLSKIGSSAPAQA